MAVEADYLFLLAVLTQKLKPSKRKDETCVFLKTFIMSCLLISAQLSQRQDGDADIIVTHLWMVYFATFHARAGIYFLIMLGF